jgi:hypothetical protein
LHDGEETSFDKVFAVPVAPALAHIIKATDDEKDGTKNDIVII